LEKGREADLCRLHYPLVRDVILKAASWPCASAYARLAVIAERDFNLPWAPGVVPPSWRFAYGQPADMLAPRYSMTFGKFAVGQSEDTPMIFSNEPDAILHYTARVTNPALFDQGLVNAIVKALAATLCIPITAKDARAARLKEEAVEAVLLARTEFANESEDMRESLPSWIQVRGMSLVPEQSRFIWPHEDLNLGMI
jgi:hypothetical protein